MDHFIIDLRVYEMTEKLDQLLDGKKRIENEEFTQKKLSKIVQELLEQYPESVDNFISLQKIIDNVFFTRTLPFFKMQSMFYLAFYYIPFHMQIFVTQDPQSVMICLGLLFFSSFVMFVMNEFLQLVDEGPQSYFSSWFNIFDFSTFPLVVAYIFNRYQYSELLPAQYVNERQTNMSVETLVGLSIMNCFLILQANVKVIFFTRMFEQFGLFLVMIINCMEEIAIFTLFFLLWIFIFTNFQIILGLEIDTEDY